MEQAAMSLGAAFHHQQVLIPVLRSRVLVANYPTSLRVLIGDGLAAAAI